MAQLIIPITLGAEEQIWHFMTEQSKNEDRLQSPKPLTDFYGEDRHELVQKLAYQHWEKRGGVGESASSETGYEVANLAEDVHQLIVSLGLEHVYVFGHDIGGMVAYAFARRYPASARGVMILDAAFPGLEPWQDILGHPAFWHVRFHQTELPEKLVSGRQDKYFRYFLSQFSDAEVAHYAQSYRDPDHLRAAFETYRAFPADEKFFAAQRSQMDLPIVIGSGEHDAFAEFLPRIAAAMRVHGCMNLTTEIVKGAGHYVAEEKPEAVAELIERNHDFL